MTDETLQRFFRVLVEALRERSPADVTGPFTVAEIYQDLVPYRTERDRLGIAMNGDYEHALLRLLAGQGEYLRLESDHALKEIREELEGKNPNTSLYRDFAAVDVRIVPDALEEIEVPGDDEVDGPAEAPTDEGEEEPTGEDSAEDPLSVADVDALADDAGVPPDTSRSETVFVEGAEPGTSEPVGDDSGAEPGSRKGAPANTGVGPCRWCGADLPDREGLVFCPYCGEDQTRVPCGSCGVTLESDWEFCISCGAPRST